jgi:tetratricopeptide (TPR) repeat protein
MAIQRDKIIASAEKLVAKGKVEAAIKEYERLLDDNPNDVNTLNRIGDLWVRVNRNDEAVKVYGKIADHYSRDGFFLKAIAIYKKINKLDPSKLDVYAKLADLYAKQGLAMEAKSQYQVLADYYMKHGDPGNALATYRKISELDPNSINVHVKLADLYSQNNQTAEALKEYDRVGRMLLKRGMLEEAVQVFRKALKIDASNIELIESLVNSLLDAKDFDNATQILEQSLEKNRENPRLIALLGRSQLNRSDLSGARATLERGLSSNPTDTGIREVLSDVYLRQNETDRALELVNPVVDAALGRGDGRTAIDLLNRILKVSSSHIPTLTRLVAAYTKLREETNILSAMNSLAEAYVARRNFSDAAGVLTELVRREPDNRQHRDKLAFVRQQLGEPGTAASPPMAPPQAAPVELPEVEETYDISSTDDFSISLDDSAPMELDLSVGADAMEPPPSIEVPSAVADLDDGESENLDFITEHMTEAEVFAKYGLTEKAVEHLRAVLDRAPRHLPAYDKLLHVYLDEGDTVQVRKVADRYLAMLRERGEDETIATVQSELASRGFTDLDSASPARRPAEPQAASLIDVEEVSPAVEEFIQPDLSPAPEEEFSLDMPETTTEIEFDVEEPPDFADLSGIAASTTETTSMEPLPAETFAVPEPEPVNDADAFSIEEPAVEAVPEFSFDTPAVDETPSFEVEPPAPLQAFEVSAPSPAPEELGEIDFYIEQDLLDEARGRLETLRARYPGNEEIAQREEALNNRAAAAAPSAAAETPATFSHEDIENELLSAIPEDDDIEILGTPKGAAAPAAAANDEASLFAEEDDFFDLAAELEDELEEDLENVSLSEEEQSLEEIFKEFKRGVEQQLDSEDYDTHYNLGIAYKEMGLIDEAIGEFQLASKDPKRVIECCSMLGLCFLEKGMPQLAIKWYSKGLEVAEITEEEQLGLLYDLGNVYIEVGDVAQAQKAFVEIYGIRNSYRDVTSRIKQLGEMGDDAVLSP